MAFGKNESLLQQVRSFRQRANQYQAQKQAARPKGGGGGLYWATQYKPPVGEADTIRVIDGHIKVKQVVKNSAGVQTLEEVDVPFYPHAEHFDGRTQRSTICSAGPFFGSKDKAAPCHGCDLFWSGMERGQDGKKKAGRMSRRELYAFTVVDYGKYHEVEQIDRRSGQVRINESTKQPYMEWVKCEGQGCDACRAGKMTRTGACRHWALGWGHYQTLLNADKQIGKSCVACGGVETVGCLAWVCASCGDAHVDMRSSTLKQKEIDELVEKPSTCGCGHTGFLQEIITCTSCTPAGGTAKRATIFDVDMNVQRVQSSDGGKMTTLNISKWSAPRPIDPSLSAFAQAKELPSIYAPTPIDVQAQRFEIQAEVVGEAATGTASRHEQPPPNHYRAS